MRWRNSKESQNVQDYRGKNTGGGGGGGMKFGIGGLVVLAIAYFAGVDPRLIMGLLGEGGAQPQAEAPVEAGAPADERGQFVAHVLGDTEETWTPIFAQAGREYEQPYVALFDDGINTGCGSATSAAGPFYCPVDHKVYIDLAFFRQLETDFAAQGDFAKAYVIAHEVGHHVQNLLGTAEKVHAAQQSSSEGDANALSVKLELQADCFAGIWANHAESASQLVEAGDIDDALNAASAVGDDTIQKRVQGHVNQESFTHGSGAARQQWFRKGYGTGSVQDCNTFQ
ncbi:MAG TPA: neutral zinc metallopeptidase [Steroidobacteraceae bacterium]|nr:neutral zinc metallopeptidase [Steroidobacteraceae bacterium]